MADKQEKLGISKLKTMNSLSKVARSVIADPEADIP